MAKANNMVGKKSEKEWRDALMVAVRRPDKDEAGKKSTKLKRIAARVVEEAIGGNMAAIQEIGNRLDGRPSQDLSIEQNTTVTVVEERLSRTVEWLGELTGSGSDSEDKEPLPN
jgi:hypothetical protein